MSALGILIELPRAPLNLSIEAISIDSFCGSRAMSPEVKVEPARLVPRAVTYHEIIRDFSLINKEQTDTKVSDQIRSYKAPQ